MVLWTLAFSCPPRKLYSHHLTQAQVEADFYRIAVGLWQASLSQLILLLVAIQPKTVFNLREIGMDWQTQSDHYFFKLSITLRRQGNGG